MIAPGDFLDRLLDRLRSIDQDQWADLTILLPGRRAGRKLMEALAQESPEGLWLPKVSTLGEWSGHLSGYHVPGKIELLVELHEAAEGLRTRHRLPEWGSLDRFQPWGLAALADFNAVDHHLLEARQVFRDLRNIKDIEAWSFGRPDLTAGQLAFLEQWNALHPLYEAFHERLLERGITTSGRLARMMATAEDALAEVRGTVWMAGANALTPAERQLMERLIRSGRGEWLWDTDRSYVQDGHEAGRFIREIVDKGARAALPHPMEEAFSADRGQVRQWNLITCSSRTMQAQYVRDRLGSTDDLLPDRTAVILPASDLAPQLLAALPTDIGKVNLTMGVALDKTPLRGFLHLLFGLHADKGRLHHARLRELLGHPLTRVLHPAAAAELAALTRKCTREAVIRLVREDLSAFPGTDALLQPWWDGRQQAAQGRDDGTITVLSAVARWTDTTQGAAFHDPWLQATWDGFREIVALHERCVERTGQSPDLAETRSRFQRWLGQHVIDLAGEPLEGLQVMGLLESRGLDFDEVFVLDVNEGTLPGGGVPPTFMPMDLQRSIGLPGRPERDGIFSAYLHRLLHRARKVHLLCVGADLGDKGVEPSRFLGQIEAWARESLPGVELRKALWSTPLPEPAPAVPPLGWSSKARESLESMLVKGISPSALNQALTCERQFHYRYVLGLGEADSVEEQLEASTIGTVIHKAVEEGLEDAVGKALTRDHLKALSNDVGPRLVKALKQTKPGAHTDSGENVLILRMAAAMIGRWVRDELRHWQDGTTVTLLGLEEDLTRTFQLEDGRTIAFRGVADRIERHDGPDGRIWQVIDYKTGMVKGSDLRLQDKDWKEKLGSGQRGKALQLLLYAAMLRATRPEAEVIRSAIRAGRKDKTDAHSLLTLEWNKSSLLDPSHDAMLEEWLVEVVDNLLPSDEDDTVEHHPDSKWCSDCLTLE